MRKYYPINLNIDGRLCLVVGGGEVAARKAQGLLDAGAAVHVVSPEVCPEVQALPVKILRRPFREADVDSAAVVIAATNDPDVNTRVAAAAQLANVPVNVVDQPGLCSFFLPAVVRRGPLVIGVSTSGASPALAKAVRRKLDKEFGEEYDKFIELLGSFRRQVLASVPDPDQRKQIFEEMASEQALDLLRTKGIDAARDFMQRILDAAKARA